MKRAPPPKLFEERKSFEEVKEAFDAFLDEPVSEQDKKLHELEALYQKKWAMQQEQVLALVAERDDLRCQKEELLIRMKEEVLQANEDAKQIIEDSRATFAEEKVNLENYNDYVKKHYEMTAKQLEEERAMEVAKLHARIAELERRKSDELLIENQMKQIITLKREVDVLTEEIEQQKKESLAQLNAKDVMYKQKLDEKTADLVRNNAILTEKMNAKTMECVQLAREAERVSNERNVLNFQLAEAKECLGPLERDIALLQEQGEAYEQERLTNKNKIDSLNRTLAEQKTVIASIKKEFQHAKRLVSVKEKTIRNFSQEIFDLVFGDQKDNENHLKRAVLDIYDKYVKGTENEERFRDLDETVVDEFVAEKLVPKRLPTLECKRQLNTLQRVADSIAVNATRTREKFEEQKKHAIADNSRLLTENKELRRKLLATERNLAISKSNYKMLEKEQALLEQRYKKPPATSPSKRRERSLESIIADGMLGDPRPNSTGGNRYGVTSNDYHHSLRFPTNELSVEGVGSQIQSQPSIDIEPAPSLSKDWSMRNMLRPGGKGF